ncbi:ABC transporter permease [Hyperthermus butylicus]|uniref:ABC transporter n=1 Tax=Hyperthermus butylicus (strain DSM 5456 / JCM 9403 / PLM1-5) TaxID=415426 RepID=A2BL90_HYPBU|nr:ABC transporter permease [Hyperthermus butylicus]ABM80751.1 putative ABC transporter [Hyperthermus butylicus DSM 5456]
MLILQFIVDAMRLALRSLSEKRLRAVLTIVGISIGPLALVAMTSVVKGYSSYVLAQLQSLGQNLIIVTPSQGYKLTEDDLRFIESLPGVKHASPFYLLTGFVRVGSEEKKVTIYATSIDLMFEAVNGLEIIEGSKPSESDLIRAVIGYNVAFDENDRQVYHAGDPITISYYRAERARKIERRQVTVIVSGIVNRFGGALFLSPDDSILLNTEAGRKLFGFSEWSGILVLAENSRYVPQITEAIRAAYRGSVEVMSFQGIANVINSIASAMEFIAFATSLAAFAVAVAGVAATMITSVIERVREIGVMKALGFTDTQVLTIILLEGVIMSLIGAAIGIGLGIAGAYVLSSTGFTVRGVTMQFTIKAEPAITVDLIVSTLLITVSVGLIGGLFPAYRAARIPPAVALRYE